MYTARPTHKKPSFSTPIGVALALMCWGHAAQAEQASFDCQKAALVDEKIICSDSMLSHADYLMGNSYLALKSSLVDPARQDALRADQHNWLLLRNRECGVTKQTKVTDDNKARYVDCFLAAYDERAADLESIKANPDKAPSDISTPIRKSQLETAEPSAEAEKALVQTNIKVGSAPLFAWASTGQLAVVAEPAGSHSASLFVWKPGQDAVISLETLSDPADIQKLCVQNDDIILIRKASSDAEPMSATVKIAPDASHASIAWTPLSSDLASACRYDLHRRLVGSPAGHNYIDLGERVNEAVSEDRFVKLYKDSTEIPMTSGSAD